MDERTRGSIEKMLDNLITKIAKVGNIEWIEKEMPIKSMRDLALGNAVGEAFARAYWLVLHLEARPPTDQEQYDAMEMLKRRLPEIIEKIERELGR